MRRLRFALTQAWAMSADEEASFRAQERLEEEGWNCSPSVPPNAPRRNAASKRPLQ